MNILYYPHIQYRAQFFLRYLWPSMQLMRRGHKVKLKDPRLTSLWTAEQMAENMLWADLVVVFSPRTAAGLKIIEFCQEYDKKVIIDSDDYSFAVDPHNPAYGTVGQKPVPGMWDPGVQYRPDFSAINLDRFATVLQQCDGLTVTQPYLADQYAPFTGHHRTWVLPNSLYIPYYKQWKPYEHKEVRIGWQGGASHYEDLRQALPALKELEQKHGTKFVSFGQPFDVITDTLENVEIHPWVESDAFYAKMGSLNLDIGICPIADTDFNRGKSNLKMLEYGVLNIPSVCSEIPNGPYNSPDGTDMDGVDRVLTTNTDDGWFEALEDLVLSKTKREHIGSNARETVEDVYNIEKTARLWDECYEAILNEQP